MSTGLRDARRAFQRGYAESAAIIDKRPPGWFGPLLASLALVGLTTAILWRLELSIGLDPLIFIYFIPTTFIALRYGMNAAMMATIMSSIAAAYYLYPPAFNFAVGDALEFMQIVFFILLAMLASQVLSGFVKDSSVEPRRAPRRSFEFSMIWTQVAALFGRPRSHH